MRRRTLLAGTFGMLALPPSTLAAASATAQAQLADLERHAGGRLGVFVLDTSSGARIDHRANERFPMCSTFKVLLVGAVLARVDARNEDLARHVAYGDADMVANSPVTKAHLSLPTMTVAELCAAAIEYSDNTAANLLLHSLLGPAAVTRFARTLGDTRTRLDRNEPALNTAIPGDPRDTTTPASMGADLLALQTGTRLSPRMRARLRTWLRNCKTGATRLRAGLPPAWRIAAKTGSGDHGTTNEIALVWPPGRAPAKPVVVAAYYTGGADDRERDATLAAVGSIVSRSSLRV